MTFQQLTYVVEISKCGSINKAAHKLVLSQSGISSAVRELEEELGIQFFVRSNRGVEFTPEGKEFLSYAISLLEQKQRIERLYEARDTAAPARFSVSTQRYPSLRTPSCGCWTPPGTAAFTSPSRKPAWMPSSTTCTTTAPTWASSS